MLRKRWMPSAMGPKSKTFSGSTETILEIRAYPFNFIWQTVYWTM